MYQSAKLCKTRLHDGLWAWAMSPNEYVHQVVRNCAVFLAANYGGRFRLPKKAENPFKMGYDPHPDAELLLAS